MRGELILSFYERIDKAKSKLCNGTGYPFIESPALSLSFRPFTHVTECPALSLANNAHLEHPVPGWD